MRDWQTGPKCDWVGRGRVCRLSLPSPIVFSPLPWSCRGYPISYSLWQVFVFRVLSVRHFCVKHFVVYCLYSSYYEEDMVPLKYFTNLYCERWGLRARAKLLYFKICESEWCHGILCDPGTSILVIVSSFYVFSFCATKRSLMSCRLRRCRLFFVSQLIWGKFAAGPSPNVHI